MRTLLSAMCTMLTCALLYVLQQPRAAETLPPDWLNDEVIRVFPTSTPPPVASSKEFTRVYEDWSSTNRAFNGISRPVRRVVVTGIEAIIDDEQPDGLWASYNGAPDISEFEFRVERLVVRSRFELPGTTITVYARELRFESNPARPNEDNAALVTTPLPPLPKARVSEDGDDGQAAGDITLFVANYFSNFNMGKRFVLTGGRGGQPGPGHDGADGLSLPICLDWGQPSQADNSEGIPDNSMVFIDKRGVHCNKCNPEHEAYCGFPPQFPTSGSDGVPCGKPGVGGAGGTLRAAVDLRPEADILGGQSAARGVPHHGGAAGTPTVAVQCYIDDNSHGRYWHRLSGNVTTQSGADAPSPAADSPQGLPGAFVLLPRSPVWATVGYARLQLAYSKAAYKTQAYALARAQLIKLLDDVHSNFDTPDSIELATLGAEASTLLNRLQAGRTFFDHPYNFSPLLSLEITSAAFEQEVRRAVSPIYVNRLAASKARSAHDRLAAIATSRAQAFADIKDQTVTINTALGDFVELEVRADQVTTQVAQLQAASKLMADLQMEHAQAAAENSRIRKQVPAWQKWLKVGEAIIGATPYGAPVSQLIDNGLNVIDDLESIQWDDPWASVPKFTDIATSAQAIFAAASPGNFKDATQKLVEELKKIDPSHVSRTNWTDYLKTIQQVAAPIQEGVRNVSSILNQAPITDGQVAAELARLQAVDSSLADIANQIADLMRQKGELVQAMSDTIQKIAAAHAACEQDLLAIGAFDAQLSGTMQIIDSLVLSRLEELAQRAVDRIQRYQSLVAASYCNAMLRPYPGTLDMDRLLARIDQFISAGGPELTPDQVTELVTLYEQDLSAIVMPIVDYYSRNFVPLTSPVLYPLRAEQLSELKTRKVLHINPIAEGYVRPSYENVRLVKVEFVDIHPTPINPADIGRVATLSVRAVHPGVGRVLSDGYEYEFFHYPADNQNPVAWGVDIDFRNGLTFTNTPSILRNSLISALVGLPELSLQSVFAALEADAAIELRLDSYADTDVELSLQGISILFTYEYVPAGQGVHSISLRASENLRPGFTVSLKDSYGRTNGYASAVRSYAHGENVMIRAEDSYENQRFAFWTDVFGRRYPSNASDRTALSLTNFSAAAVAVAVYRPSEPVLIVKRPRAGIIELEWTSLPGVVYRVQELTDIHTATWQDAASPVKAGDVTTSLTLSPSGRYRFYRVVAE